MDIIQIFEEFPTQESCIKHLENVRWGDMVLCPYCASIKTAPHRKRWRCYDCKTSFSVTVGTIFHHTHLPLQKWFLAINLILNAKKGISALQLSRDIHVNKNTAWRIAMQIRKAMTQAEQRILLTGVIEMDETYVGGKPRKDNNRKDDDNKPNKRGRGTDKTPVVGAVERGGKATAKAVNNENMKGRHMRASVRERIKTHESVLITDEYRGYMKMEKVLPQRVIKHDEWYVDGDVHTNTIQGFWALLKRGMFGSFHSVSRKYLQRYVDQFCYR